MGCCPWCPIPEGLASGCPLPSLRPMGPVGNVGGQSPVGPPEDSREGLPETTRWVGVVSPRGVSSLDVKRGSEGFCASSLPYVCSAGRLAERGGTTPGHPPRAPSPGVTPASSVTAAGLHSGGSAGGASVMSSSLRGPKVNAADTTQQPPRPRGPGAPALRTAPARPPGPLTAS